MPWWRTPSGALALCLLALTGCYGSTEPAGEVTADGARLHAQGTANNGPAYSYFDWWPTADPDLQLPDTPRRNWPAGASGPFSERIGAGVVVYGFTTHPLYPSTSYSYRLCGGDEGQPPVCAQTRTFTTPVPVEDAVKGNFFRLGGMNPEGSVNAVGDRNGANPRGTLEHTYPGPGGLERFSGQVNCLSVDGNRGVVGALGRGEPGGRPYASRLTVVDGDYDASDRVLVESAPGATPYDCATAPNPQDPSAAPDAVVYDAP